MSDDTLFDAGPVADQPESDAPPTHMPITIIPTQLDLGFAPGFWSSRDDIPREIQIGWNRMLSIVRDVGEATDQTDLHAERQLAREFFKEAVTIVRQYRMKNGPTA